MQTTVNLSDDQKGLDRINIMLNIQDRIGPVKMPHLIVEHGQMVCSCSYIDPYFKNGGADVGTSDIAALFAKAHEELDKLKLMVEEARSHNEKAKMKGELQAADADHEVGVAAMGGMNLDDDSAGIMVDSRASKL